MSSVGARALQLPAAENAAKMRKPAAGPRRVALGEITNVPGAAGHAKRFGLLNPPVKQSCAQKAKPVVQMVHPIVQVPAPADLPPLVPEPSVDVPMKEEEEEEEEELCQAFSEVLLTVQDVDEEDSELPQLCSHYVKDIYNYLHVLEVQQAIRADYMQGYDITGRMRALLVDWLVQVHSRFQLLQETLYLTVAILDRFLQVQPVGRRRLQLVGVSAMLVACKYEEMYTPEVGDFTYITDDAFTKAEVLEMEQLVLKALNFQLGRPLPLHFLRRASKVANRFGLLNPPVKQSCAQKAKPVVQMVHPIVQVPAPADLPPLVPEPSVDVPMKEEEEEEEEELCQAFSEVLLTVQDVDEEDSELPQLCSHYVKDIYNYLHVLEVQQAIRADYMQGYDITGRMRALLVDWLVQVHSRFQLLQETLYLTVAILDRFLQVQPVGRRRLQLVGVSAMLVACKYEEMYTPEVGDFTYITDDAFTKAEVLEMEQLVLKALNFQLGRPLPLHFLRRASKVANTDVEKHTLAKYLMELTLVDYSMVHYRPSEVAAASLCLSQLLLDALPWSATQQRYSSYDAAHLKPIMQRIAKNVVMVNQGATKFLAVRNKYCSRTLMKISLLPQLTSTVITDLAAALHRP